MGLLPCSFPFSAHIQVVSELERFQSLGKYPHLAAINVQIKLKLNNDHYHGKFFLHSRCDNIAAE